MVKNKIMYLLICFLSACVMAGTHGSIKGYEFPVSKMMLQNAVEKVIAENNNIQRIDTNVVNVIVDITNGNNDTIHSDNHYNDGNRYVNIKIKNKNQVYEYIFQYLGSEKGWDTSTTSSLSIAYAYDEHGNGGSEGNRGFPRDKTRLKEELILVFEQELISKLDRQLNVKHTNSN